MTETTLDGKWVYSYDPIGQLTHAIFTSNNAVQIPNQDLQYFYDPSGNRTSTIINGVTTTYTVNVRNEYTQVGLTAYGYDADGNRIRQTDATGTTTYSYNADNRLSGIQPPAGPASAIQYDAFGAIYSTTLGNQTTRSLVDPQTANLVGQFGAAGSSISHFAYGVGLVSQITAGIANFYDFDIRGSTAGITNAAGAYVNSYAYAPFGTTLTANPGLATPFQFVGRWGVETLGSGVDLMGLRAYDPLIGQFVADDPLHFDGGDVDLRRYAGNNVITRIDPVGTDSVKTTANEIAEIVNEMQRLAEEAQALPMPKGFSKFRWKSTT